MSERYSRIWGWVGHNRRLMWALWISVALALLTFILQFNELMIYRS